MMEILLEIFPRSDFGQDALEDRLVVFEEFLERVGAEVFSRAKVDEFSKGESVQPVLLRQRVEFGVVVFSSAHRSGGIDNAEIGETIVALNDLFSPVGELESLVDEQDLSSEFDEFGSKVYQFSSLEIEGVHIGIEALSQSGVKVFLGVGEQELCASYTSGATNANEAVAPIDGVHKTSPYGRIGVLYEESV